MYTVQFLFGTETNLTLLHISLIKYGGNGEQPATVF